MHPGSLCFPLALAMLAPCLLPAQEKPAYPLPKLTDITASTGIHFEHLSSPEAKYIVESMSGGVALLDYDGDGYPDIYFTNAPSVAMALAGKHATGALYHNNHSGTFTDVTAKAGVGQPCWAMGVAVGDYNNDGRPDLAVSCFGGVVLYRNNGDGTFTNVTKASGLDKDQGWATGVSFGDYNNDGNSDLFVPHYVDLDMASLPAFGAQPNCLYHTIQVQCGPRGLRGSPDALYRNNGDGTFRNVAAEAGVSDPKHYFGLTSLWTDLDNDGLLDLIVANDGESNFLYKNLGGGKFKDVAAEAGVAFSEDGLEQANMGIAEGDYLNDGRMDFVISHFSDEYATLYRDDGPMNFSDVSYASGIAHASAPYVGWGDAFVDLNNDGWRDLVVANGHVYPQVADAKTGILYREPMLVFQNERNGKFTDISQALGAAVTTPRVSRGLAVGDLFNTGALDIVVENLTGQPTILAAGPDPANHWVSFTLEGWPKNRLALNARMHVTTGTMTQTSEVHSGGSYLSQNDLRQHFGLGRAATIDKVEVVWSDGKTQTFPHVAGNHFYHLREGGQLETLK